MFHGGLEWDLTNAGQVPSVNSPGVRCIRAMGLLWDLVVPMAVGWTIKGVGYCTEGVAAHPICLSGIYGEEDGSGVVLSATVTIWLWWQSSIQAGQRTGYSCIS